MLERLKRRHSGLYFFISGSIVVIDQLGRFQTIKDMYSVVRSWFAIRTDIHLKWPPHLLLYIGLVILAIGLFSFLLPPPKSAETSGTRSAPIGERIVRANPHIDLVFDLPAAASTGPGQLIRDQRIKVVNTSETIAYDVSIQPMESHLYKATFETIGRVDKEHPAYAVMNLRSKEHGTYFNQFEALLRYELENSSEDEDFKVRVPMVVRFYDDKKDTLYQTRHEVVYQAFWQEAHTHLVEGTVPVKATPPLPDVATLVNTGPGPNKTLARRITGGADKLMAWEILREGLPKCYFVEFSIRGHEPKTCITADYSIANKYWNEWYKIWSTRPGDFGGASGDGLDGKPPW